jgi:hypothetical protein
MTQSVMQQQQLVTITDHKLAEKTTQQINRDA